MKFHRTVTILDLLVFLLLEDNEELRDMLIGIWDNDLDNGFVGVYPVDIEELSKINPHIQGVDKVLEFMKEEKVDFLIHADPEGNEEE